MTTKFEEVAEELSSAFTTQKRDDKTIYNLKDEFRRSKEGWINSDLMLRFHKAIDDRMPDDWIYEVIANGSSSLAEYEDVDAARDAIHEIADGMVDVYNSDVLRWLADHQMNACLCDEAAEEFGGADNDTIKRAQLGQYLGITRILSEMVEAIEEEAEERETDEEEDDEDDES